MTTNLNHLKRWIADMAALMEQSAEPDPQHYAPFLDDPDLALSLVEVIAGLDDEQLDHEHPYYSACVFALEICVAQLQTAKENGSKAANKSLKLLMSTLARAIKRGKQNLSFWLPILNAFYEGHIELSEELKQSYLSLVDQEDYPSSQAETDHLNAIREIIAELSDLSAFDIAENFFAQSYAMPPDFFADLIIDLYSIEEGQDIALLTLLHPKQEVRDIVVATFEQLVTKINLSSISLSRLQVIKNWYPQAYHERFNRWLKIQRKKGVVFSQELPKPSLQIKATEVDGNGAQGIFIHIKQNRKNRLCSLLLKQEVGIKDAWVAPEIKAGELAKHYDETFDDSVTLREVDESYLLIMIGHFLALTIAQNNIPNLHLLEIQELLGLQFHPELITISYLIESLSVQIAPFTAEAMQGAFKRSKNWINTKQFAESWYVENAHVDKLVNRYCSFVDGAKVCAVEEAMASVFANELEKQRDKWLFHFLWTALWARSKARKNEKISQDCFFIAYAIHTDQALSTIPIMQEICRQTVLNSIETMQDRRTYLA